ncbi:MAG: hypothetical protein E7453_06090 [Ruminococcaceae bacterium]|nr:hypothetical protein [Oscillospiraceae bacterium]
MKILKKVKAWFLDRFLPIWAKETVLADNRRLNRRVAELENELAQKTAYINGISVGLKSLRRITVNVQPKNDEIKNAE